MPSLTLADAALRTGLTTDAIRDLARTIVERTPTVVIANDDSPAIAALNVVLGAMGTSGGIVRRSKQSTPYVSADAVIAGARAVLIDSSVPWNFAPQTTTEVFRFAAWDGGSSKANWLLPAPGFLEELTDVPTPPTSAIETYAIAPSLSKPAPGVQSAAQFLSSMDPTLSTTEKIIHARCKNIFRDRLGTLIGRDTIAVAKLDSPQKLEEQLRKGAVWVGKASRPEPLRCDLPVWPTAVTSGQPESWSTAWPAPVLPPLTSKLYVESTLREAPEKRNA